MENNPFIENAVKYKSSFDGRLKYFDTLEIYMATFAKALLNNDLTMQYFSLRGFYSLTAPFITEDANTKSKAILDKVKKNIQVKNSHAKLKVQEQLLEASEVLNHNAKHLLLPTQLDENDDIDWDNAI